MKLGRAAVAALAVLLAGGAVLAAALVHDAPGSRGDASAVAFRTGDRLTYAGLVDGAQARLEIRAIAPRLVRAADQSLVWGLPLLVAPEGPEPREWDAFVADLSEGGLAVSAEGCLFEDVPCRDPSAATTYVTWQACPLNSLFSPLDVIPARALDPGREIHVTDPVEGTTWTYRVTEEPRGRVAIDLVRASGERALCGPADRLVVDPRSGRVESITTGLGQFRLVDVTRGDGPEIRLAGRTPDAGALADKPIEREDPFPAGTASVGPEGWTIRDAWRAAVAESSALREYLRAHPEAFATSAENATERVGVGPIVAGSEAWTMTLLATDRSAFEVTAVRSTLAGVPRHDIGARPVPPPEGAPATPHAPALVGRDARAIAQVLDASGFLAGAGIEDAHFGVQFDGGVSSFRWSFPSAPAIELAGGSVQGAFVTVDADAGRVTDADLPWDRARAWIVPSGEASS